MYLKKGLLIFLLFTTNIFCGQPKKLSVIGIGRLGMCVALCLERAGFNVLGLDVFPDYVAKINNKEFNSNEPFLVDYFQESKNFRATTSLDETLQFSDIYLITISTTTGTDGYNFEALSQLLRDINARAISNKHIVICSTIFPGYINDTAKSLLGNCTNITISYNPPFIAQGNIIYGLQSPDMVLIGEGSSEIGNILEGMHKSVCVNLPHIARMSVESAEITKLAVNCFITMKIAYANLIGDIASETPGADAEAILYAAGKDQRIGSKCLMPGFGFGGPCFPRDNRALGRYAITKKIEPMLFMATDKNNALHADHMAKKLVEKNLSEYVFEDISYKPNSPVKIIEESQPLAVAKRVAEQGKRVVIVDTAEAIKQVQAKYGNLFHYVLQEQCVQ